MDFAMSSITTHKEETPLNFKKMMALVLALALALSLAACSQSDNTQTTDTESDQYAVDYTKYFDEEGNWLDLDASAYITLPEDYASIQIPADELAVTEEEIQEQIDYLLSQFPETEEITDRAVEDGDSVNIDYVGRIDGEEFEGGNTNGAGTVVTIGVTQYIDDFLEQLIGHKPGETFDIEVTFPDDYTTEELSGKDAVFETTINYIQESKTPELTDEFVATNLASYYSVSTVEDLKAYLEDSLTLSKTDDYIYNYVLENSTFAEELPAVFTDYQKDDMLAYYASFASSYGMTLEDFMSSYFGTDDVNSLFEDEAAQETMNTYAKQYLIYQAISQDAALEITDEDLDAYLAEVAGDQDPATLKENYDARYLMFNCRSYHANQLLLDGAQVV